MAIKLLTFDLDDTLWPNRLTIERTEENLYQWFAQHHPEISQKYSVTDLRKKRLLLAKNHPHIAHDLTRLRKKSFTELSRELGYHPHQEQQFINEAFELYIRERNKVNLYNDVLPTLEKLKARYRLGAVSNGNADIYRIGLGHLLDFSWSAAEAGQQKPHPLVFESLLEREQLTTDEIIHIGDDPVTDIIGAQQSGIQGIWLNRHHIPWPENVPPLNSALLEIDQLNQLPALLEQL